MPMDAVILREHLTLKTSSTFINHSWVSYCARHSSLSEKVVLGSVNLEYHRRNKNVFFPLRLVYRYIPTRYSLGVYDVTTSATKSPQPYAEGHNASYHIRCTLYYPVPCGSHYQGGSFMQTFHVYNPQGSIKVLALHNVS